MASHYPFFSDTVQEKTVLHTHTWTMSPSRSGGYMQDTTVSLHTGIHTVPQTEPSRNSLFCVCNPNSINYTKLTNNLSTTYMQLQPWYIYAAKEECRLINSCCYTKKSLKRVLLTKRIGLFKEKSTVGLEGIEHDSCDPAWLGTLIDVSSHCTKEDFRITIAFCSKRIWNHSLHPAPSNRRQHKVQV